MSKVKQWFDGLSFPEVEAMLVNGSAPGSRTPGAFVTVPGGFLEWSGGLNYRKGGAKLTERVEGRCFVHVTPAGAVASAAIDRYHGRPVTFNYRRLLPGKVVCLRFIDGEGGFYLRVEDEQEVQGAVAEPGPEDPLQACDCQTLPVEGSIGCPGPLPDAFSDEVPEVEGVGGDAESEAPVDETPRFFGIGVGAWRGIDLARQERTRPSGFGAFSAPLGGLTDTEAELLARQKQAAARAIAEQMRLSGLGGAYGGQSGIDDLGRLRQHAPRQLSHGVAAWASLDKLVADAIAGGAASGTLTVTSGGFRASASWKGGVVESAYMSKTRPDREP